MGDVVYETKDLVLRNANGHISHFTRVIIPPHFLLITAFVYFVLQCVLISVILLRFVVFSPTAVTLLCYFSNVLVVQCFQSSECDIVKSFALASSRCGLC